MTEDAVIDAGRLVDEQRFNPLAARLLLLSLLAVVSDGYDLQAAAYVGPELVKAWHIERAALGPMFSAGLVGLLFGAPIFGYLGDRFGRKRALVAGCFVYGVFTLAAMAARSIDQLIALRFLTGLGLGGLLPNVVALNTELAPRRMRAAFVIIVFFGMPLGGALPGPIAAELMPRFGWPVIFLVGGLAPLLIGVFLLRLMPESIKYLLLHEHRRADALGLLRRLRPEIAIPEEARFAVPAATARTGASPKELFSGGLALMTPLLWLAFACNLMANFIVNSWLPTLLQEGGFSVASAAYITTLLFVGGMAGGGVMVFLVDRWGVLPAAGLFLCGVPLAAGLGFAGSAPAALSLLSLGLGFCIVGIQNGLNAISGMLYPTPCRAKGAGWAFAAGRCGAVLGPMIGAALVARHASLPQFFLAPAIAMAVGAAASLALLRLCRRRFGGAPIGDAASGVASLDLRR
jgi:AAHS family 4-hydroxybenzoate transporter-like MFS transporter